MRGDLKMALFEKMISSLSRNFLIKRLKMHWEHAKKVLSNDFVVKELNDNAIQKYT